ncbi:MAG: hypothetical protein R3258_03210 [Acidimicrobiia bacterium]|nr:hypothetical protein [Acidimicrobiia bacterium]
MAFRSHLGRRLDMRLPSNRAIVALTLVIAAASAVVVLSGGDRSILLAPLHTFALWALLREIDPDHNASALLAAAAGGLWVISGLNSSGLTVTAGVAVAARVAVSSTGRRPLPTDLFGLVVIAAVVSLWGTGWVAGFAIAVAIYVDHRMADEKKPATIIVAAIAGLVAAAVGSLVTNLPADALTVMPEIILPTGILALFAIIREPAPPISVVDSRRGGKLSVNRLHAARGIGAVAIFVATLVAGPESAGMVPAGLALAIALVSNEGERRSRSV